MRVCQQGWCKAVRWSSAAWQPVRRGWWSAIQLVLPVHRLLLPKCYSPPPADATTAIAVTAAGVTPRERSPLHVTAP